MRVETMVAMGGLDIPPKSVRHYISSALDVIIQASRLADGSRKLTSLQEITGMEGDVITLQEIFAFEQTGIAANGGVRGKFRATGIRPRFLERLQTLAIVVPPDLFDTRKVYDV